MAAAYNPYRAPSPYDILELPDGPMTSQRDISAAINQHKKKAKLIKDAKQKAQRMQEVEQAGDQLLRPEDRVLIDFFLPGANPYVELALSISRRIAAAPLPVQNVVGRLFPKHRYDDLMPEKPERFITEFQLPENLPFFDSLEPAESRLALTAISV